MQPATKYTKLSLPRRKGMLKESLPQFHILKKKESKTNIEAGMFRHTQT